MASVLRLKRNEWEAFLEEFSEFTKNYEFILSRLELAETRIEGQRQRAQQLSVESDHAVKEEPAGRVERESVVQQPVKAQLRLLGRFFRIKHFTRSVTSKARNSTGPRTSCEKCGDQIKRASRYCESCGGDFGALICPCGRGLNADDKFCDRCGRTI